MADITNRKTESNDITLNHSLRSPDCIQSLPKHNCKKDSKQIVNVININSIKI